MTTVLFLSLIFGFALWGLLTPDLERSESEKRPLATFPEIDLLSLLSTGEDNAMETFGDYVSDHFPARDGFRALKAWLSYNLYGQRLSNGYFKHGEHVGKLEESINGESISHFAEAVGIMYCKYFSGNDSVFYTVVPDKGYFLASKESYPSMDYEKFLSILAKKLPSGIEYIDILDTLTLDDYYKTDIHWSSERLAETVKVIADKMGILSRLSFEHETLKLTDAFKGVYNGQAALPLSPETVRYITSPEIEGAKVTVELTPVDGIYNKEYMTDINGYYTYFLYGSKSYITVENPMAAAASELVLIRDSFGSAIVPWLVEAYSRITVLDIRYISPHTLGAFLTNSDADVLFLYSTSIINDSSAIKK